MPKKIAEYQPTLLAQFRDNHLRQHAEHYYTSLRRKGFCKHNLTRLPLLRLRELYKSADTLLKLGYPSSLLILPTLYDENGLSPFCLIRLHKILTILNHEESVVDQITWILNTKRRSIKFELFKKISMLHDLATRVPNFPPDVTTACINQIFLLLNINKCFDSTHELTFLTFLNKPGTGDPMPLQATSIPIQIDLSHAAIEPWANDPIHELHLLYNSGSSNELPEAYQESAVAEFLSSLNEMCGYT